MEHRHGLEPANAGRDDALVTGLLVDDTLGCGHRCVDPQRLLALGDLAGAATFGGDGGDGAIGMDMTGFIMEMPLISLLQFNEESLPGTAEQMVDEMLAQMHALE